MAKPPNLTEPTDLPRASGNWFAAMIFYRSTGRGSRLALAMAKAAAEFQTFEADAKNIGYFAGFNAAAEDIGRMIALARISHTWSGTMIFIRGLPIRWNWMIEQNLQCLMNSYTQDDAHAYCHHLAEIAPPILSLSIELRLPGSLPPLANEPRPKLRIPCRRVSMASLRRWKTTEHWKDAVLSAAVEAECQWCPRLVASDAGLASKEG